MAQIIASMSGAVLNLLLIMALGRVYEKLALKLTTWGEKMFKVLMFLGIHLEEIWARMEVPPPLQKALSKSSYFSEKINAMENSGTVKI